jgi:hypothetical protein
MFLASVSMIVALAVDPEDNRPALIQPAQR